MADAEVETVRWDGGEVMNHTDDFAARLEFAIARLEPKPDEIFVLKFDGILSTGHADLIHRQWRAVWSARPVALPIPPLLILYDGAELSIAKQEAAQP